MLFELAIYLLRYTLTVRRFVNLWDILSRELIRKIHDAQKCNVDKGDWVQIIKKEREKYGLLERDETVSREV